ncbi:MAG: hypothetical protein ACODAE_07990, partial [Gemmatimonadota bacterium]
PRDGRARAGAGTGIAVALALLALVAAGVAPVRAWIAEGWQALAAWAVDAEPATTIEAAPDAEPDVSVSFLPRDPTFRIELAAAPDGGRLVVRVVDAWEANAEVVGGPDAELLVRPDGVRIENEGAARARYRVSVPVGTRRVEVYVAGRRVAARPAPAAPDTAIAIDFGADP